MTYRVSELPCLQCHHHDFKPHIGPGKLNEFRASELERWFWNRRPECPQIVTVTGTDGHETMELDIHRLLSPGFCGPRGVRRSIVGGGLGALRSDTPQVCVPIRPYSNMAPWPNSSEPQFTKLQNMGNDGLCLTGFL